MDVASGHLSNLGAKVAQREIKTEGVKPGLSTSGSMLLLYSLQAFRYSCRFLVLSECVYTSCMYMHPEKAYVL